VIHIDYPAGRLPDQQWLDEANALTERLRNAATQAERNRIIDENKDVWGKVKDWLMTFSHNKCWFTEARDCGSHWHVEHFRPKKSKAPDHEGYWWRAFDYRNYRLCGSVPNAGKGSDFPLRPGSPRATGPDTNCDDEAHVLIDPTLKVDVQLLTFIRGGQAAAFEADSWNRHRAEVSIKRYKLNDHSPLSIERERVWNTCWGLLVDLERLIAEDMVSRGDSPSRRKEMEHLKRRIAEMARPQTPFSAVARALLLHDDRSWVRQILD